MCNNARISEIRSEVLIPLTEVHANPFEFHNLLDILTKQNIRYQEHTATDMFGTQAYETHSVRFTSESGRRFSCCIGLCTGGYRHGLIELAEYEWDDTLAVERVDEVRGGLTADEAWNIVLGVTPLKIPMDVQFLNVDFLLIPEEYCSKLSQNRVQRMVETFETHMFGALDVSIRVNEYGDKKYYVIDGHHRLAAAMALHFSEAPCIVHHGLSVNEEAAIFLVKNGRRATRI